MKRLLLLALVALTAGTTVNLAAVPIGRTDLPWWRARFAATLADAKADPNARVIWLGDSITENWQRPAMLPVWNRYYAPYRALDLGFIGDTTASLIWRLDHGQVAGLHPRLAIVLIGANNLGLPHWPASKTVPGIEAVVANVERRLPDTHILLLGVLPSIRSAWVDAQTVAINARLAHHYANDPRVTFTNPGTTLLGADGKPDAALYLDPAMRPPEPALHPTAAGMARIAHEIEPLVVRYAGPAAS